MDQLKKDSEANFKFVRSDTSNDSSTDQLNQDETADYSEKEETLFNWTAPDSFSSNKSITWYLSLILITVVLSGGIYLLTKDKITTSVFIVSGLLLGFYGAKKPKVINYQLTNRGIDINGKRYSFANYRAYSIVHHDNNNSIILTPLRRFMPYMYIYFNNNEVEEKVVNLLDNTLPRSDHNDFIDKLLRKTGF